MYYVCPRCGGALVKRKENMGFLLGAAIILSVNIH
jgi:hypothetical protein